MTDITVLKVDLDKLKKSSLLIATPMYGGMTTATYYLAMSSMFYFAGKNELSVDSYVIWNESLVPRGRNSIVDYFLETDKEFLMFVDGDIGFNIQDIYYMWHLMLTEKDKKIVAGIYPKKTINWKIIQEAVNSGFIKSSEDFAKYSGDYVVSFSMDPNENIEFSLDKPLEVLEAGTGFMMIHRSVFEKFKEAYPEQHYLQTTTRKPMVAYFDCKIDPDDNTYLSEDYMFCRWAKKIGIKTWVLPWLELSHMGTYNYEASFVDHSIMKKSLMDKNIRNIKLI